MSSFKIKTTANYTIDSNSINLTNAPPTNVGSTDLLARNAGTGELEVMPIGSIPSATNIYNADGSLTGDRLVTVGANSLTFLGGVLSNSVFNVDVNEINEQASDGIVLYGVTSAELKSDDATTVYGANSTTIGNVSNFGPVNIHAGLNGNLFIDQLVNTNNSNILYYNSANGRVTYSVPPSSSVQVANLGAGNAVLANPGAGAGPFNFKTILAGNGITLTPTANDLTVASRTQLANLGAGNTILANPGNNAGPFNFKTLIGGTNVTLTPTANDITISATAGNVDLENIGVGEIVLSNPGTGAGPFNFKTFVAGDNTTVSSTAGDVRINTALGGLFQMYTLVPFTCANNGDTPIPGTATLSDSLAGFHLPISFYGGSIDVSTGIFHMPPGVGGIYKFELDVQLVTPSVSGKSFIMGIRIYPAGSIYYSPTYTFPTSANTGDIYQFTFSQNLNIGAPGSNDFVFYIEDLSGTDNIVCNVASIALSHTTI